MPTNNSSNNSYTNNADGFSLAGGTTPRTLSLTAGNVTLSAGGSNTYTMPSATDTLVGRASTDTLTNKTLTSPVVNQFGTASGLGAAWSSYTPTWTNLTVGSATQVARYLQIGKLVTVRFSIVLSGSTVGTDVSLSLPVTSATVPGTGNITQIGQWAGFDTSASGINYGMVGWSSTTAAILRILKTDTTYASAGIISSTVPFTWANGDEIAGEFMYEAA